MQNLLNQTVGVNILTLNITIFFKSEHEGRDEIYYWIIMHNIVTK